MKFNVDSDEGAVLRLWLALDNPSDVPVLSVWSKGTLLTELAANTMRPDVRDHGLHTTGECGFTLNDTVVPGIAKLAGLELRDAASGIVIYGRFRPEQHLLRKILVWSRPSLARPDAWVDQEQYSLVYPDIEVLPVETLRALLDNSRAQSMVAIGRPNLLRFSELLDRQGFEVNFVLTDPYVDLAERLLRLLRSRSEAHEDKRRLLATLEPRHLDDHRGLVRFFRTLERSESIMLRSPVVRALTKAPEEGVRRQDVTTALKVLARYQLVCTEQSLHLFGGGARVPPPNPEVLRLSDRLQQIEAVSDLLNEDIALYRYVGQAVAVAQDADAQFTRAREL